jgi:hypothetical protein
VLGEKGYILQISFYNTCIRGKKLPVHSYTKKCGVQGWKTFPDHADKLEETGTPYVWRVTLVSLELSGVCARL